MLLDWGFCGSASRLGSVHFPKKGDCTLHHACPAGPLLIDFGFDASSKKHEIPNEAVNTQPTAKSFIIIRTNRFTAVTNSAIC